jgi:hypothetical protein
MKDSARAVRDYLEREYPRFVSVPELNISLRQSDARKRVSELILEEKLPIEKERKGNYVNYRYRAKTMPEILMGRAS